MEAEEPQVRRGDADPDGLTVRLIAATAPDPAWRFVLQRNGRNDATGRAGAGAGDIVVEFP